MKRNSNALAISLALLCLQESAAFAPIASSRHANNAGTSRQQLQMHSTKQTIRKANMRATAASTRLQASENANADVDKLRAQAAKMKLEAEKLEAELNLQKINKLEAEIKASESLNDKAKASKRNDIRSKIEALASRVDPAILASLEQSVADTATTTTPTTVEEEAQLLGVNLALAMKEAMKDDDSPNVSTQTNLYANRVVKPAITEEELTVAVQYYTSLPKPMRQALAKSIDLDEQLTAPAIIVLGLYELAGSLSDAKLKRLYEEELRVKTPLKQAVSGIAKLVQEGKEPDDPFNPFALPDANNPEQVNNMVENFLPRQTRKEGTIPSKVEVEVFTMQVLGTKAGKDIFQQSGKPEPISGGFVVRGKMAPTLKDDGDKLIEMLDEKIDELIPKEWSERYQVSYMTDPTPTMLVSDDLNGAPVLVVHSRDMNPSTSALLNSGVSAVSIFLTFVFAIGIFGQNDVIMQRLSSAQGQTGFDLTWFNQLVTPFLIAIGITQASHEVAHLAVAKKEGFKITPPTILPLMSLPYMSFQNRIKTSPKNLNTLFNFAFIGPAVGMVASFIFLLLGLQMTLEMTPEQVQYAASVPVSFLQLSSLGANIVDYVLGGGDGLILQQDPSTAVILHPFAIAGFAGLMINALDTIPLAGTDGGRMSQALLGRPGHVAFSALTYIAILLYTLFSGHQDIFLTYLFVTSFTQKDLEIPARNDVDQAGLGQAAIALTMWCVAILALTPTN